MTKYLIAATTLVAVYMAALMLLTLAEQHGGSTT